LNGGAGVKHTDGQTEWGWNSEWDRWLTNSKASWDSTNHLGCDPTLSTWTPSPGANENYAINCLSWFEAYAFCIWDGAFLPTEAEWNYAAAGGAEQREYPWGGEPPSPSRALYLCTSGGTPGCSSWNVGSRPRGDGRFGQADLAGSAWEWTLDAFVRYQIDWTDCSGKLCTDYPMTVCYDCAYLGNIE
jgi:formylglycine-generating enzyme required for sulfatase activity